MGESISRWHRLLHRFAMNRCVLDGDGYTCVGCGQHTPWEANCWLCGQSITKGRHLFISGGQVCCEVPMIVHDPQRLGRISSEAHEQPQSADAVDPSVTSTGKLTTREKV